MMGEKSKEKSCSSYRYAAEDPTLPKPWRALVDANTGYIYFWNPLTNVTQYEKPKPADLPNPNPKSVVEEEHNPNPNPNPKSVVEEERHVHNEDSQICQEIQKLVDHNAILGAKKQEFELEMEKRRKSFDEEIKSKLEAMDKEKKELSRKEEQIIKREQALENKLEKLEINEKVLQTKSEALEKREAFVKSDEKKLEEEKKQLMKDFQDLISSRTELESLRSAVEAEQQMICSKENLALTKVEREQHLELLGVQAKLKQEIEYWMMKGWSLIKESDALREKVEKFDREWEMLDDKRMALETEVRKLDDEKERFGNWLLNERERLKNEGLQARADIQEELEDFRLKKEAFENFRKQEKSVAHTKNSQHIDEECIGASLHADPLVAYSKQSRHHPERVFSSQVKKLDDETERIAKWLQNGWEMLTNEGLQSISDIHKESEDLRFKRLVKNFMEHKQSVAHAEDSQHIGVQSREASLHDYPVVHYSRQKRHHPESVSMGDSPAKRQTSATGLQASGDKPYNLRSCTVLTAPGGSDQDKKHRAI